MPTVVNPASVLAEEAPTISLPIDISEMASVASLQLFVTPMAKRLFWLRDRINNGIRRIRTATSIAAMRGLPATTGEFCFLVGDDTVPIGLYVYSDGPFTMGWSEDKAPWQYASSYHSGAMWFSVLHQSIGGNTNSIATVNENGRLTAKGPNAIRSIGFSGVQASNTVYQTDGDTALAGVVTVQAAASDVVFADALVNIGGPGVTAGTRTTTRLSWSTDGTTWTNFAMANTLVSGEDASSVSVHGAMVVDPSFVGTATLRIRVTGATTATLSMTVNGVRVQVVQP